MQLVCVFFHIWTKFEFLISQGSVGTCLRWGGLCPMFCSKFHTLSSSAKSWRSVKIWQSYRQFKGGNFFL